MKTISMLTAFIKFVSSEIYSPRRIICILKKDFQSHEISQNLTYSIVPDDLYMTFIIGIFSKKAG